MRNNDNINNTIDNSHDEGHDNQNSNDNNIKNDIHENNCHTTNNYDDKSRTATAPILMTAATISPTTSPMTTTTTTTIITTTTMVDPENKIQSEPLQTYPKSRFALKRVSVQQIRNIVGH